jgi:hypothetical protein
VSSINDLAGLIGTLKARHDRAFDADLTRLKTAYGERAVDQALQVSRQSDLRSSLSVSGQRMRRREQRQSERLAAEVFRAKPHDP